MVEFGEKRRPTIDNTRRAPEVDDLCRMSRPKRSMAELTPSASADDLFQRLVAVIAIVACCWRIRDAWSVGRLVSGRKIRAAFREKVSGFQRRPLKRLKPSHRR